MNLVLHKRGKGHALTHDHHGGGEVSGARRFIPALTTATLGAAIVAFMLGGLVVSIADELDGAPSAAVAVLVQHEDD